MMLFEKQMAIEKPVYFIATLLLEHQCIKEHSVIVLRALDVFNIKIFWLVYYNSIDVSIKPSEINIS